MNEINSIAWQRFSLIATISGDVIGRLILTLFYFTFLMPFGIGYTLFGNPFGKSGGTGPSWLDREPVPTDIESAKQQG